MTYDAILIGAGHNALTTGVLLAKAGWSVAVFERAEVIGGAVRTAEWTRPGFRHDAFGAAHILIFISPFYREFRSELEAHGLKYLKFPVPIASVFPDGGAVCMHRDPERTLAGLEKHSAADAAGWDALYRLYKQLQGVFAAFLNSPLPSAGALGGLIPQRLRLGPLAFRPFPGWSRNRTPVRRLYLSGAATHPGMGISAGPGYITARILLGMR